MSEISHLELKGVAVALFSEIPSRGPLHMNLVSFHPGFLLPLCFSARQTGDSSENKYHSFREFNQEKEKTWRAGSEPAPPPLPKAAACPWGEGASNPICKRRKCRWEGGQSRPLGNWPRRCHWGEMIIVITWSIIIIRDRKQAQVISVMVKSHYSDSHSWFKRRSISTCSGGELWWGGARRLCLVFPT